ncbi:MAG: pseudouridine synthase [Ideonella sp. WA131b]|jgi:23S rRNA pseudouridine2605 synthase|nr:pseudouridine synthase [Ideonella sp. WA131b]
MTPPDDADTPLPEPIEAAAPPKRRRAPRKAAVDVPAPTPGEMVGAVEAPTRDVLFTPAADTPTQRVRKPRKAAEAATADQGVPAAARPLAEPLDTAVEARAGEADAAAPATPAGGGSDGAAPDDAEPRGRRRNRRRGRRGRRDDDTPGAVDAAPPAPAGGDAGEVFHQVLMGAFDREAEIVRMDVAPGGSVALAGDALADADDTAPAVAAVADAVADAEEAAPDQAFAEARRVLAPDHGAPKLHKVLAQSGVGSRRDLEQMIVEGRVAVNGTPAHVGQRVSFGDRIALDGKPVKVRIQPPKPRVLAYHKPAGEVVTHDDPQQRPTVFRRLPRLPHGKWQSVGRLDMNTEGLLLFTNSGELANQLMHPRFGVEREYAVRSLGMLSEESKRRLLEGVEIDGQRAAFMSIEDGGGEGANHWYRVVITEGRNREVRRLFEAVGHAVSRLIRIRYGCVVLPRGLRRGVWVDLGEDDLRALRRLTSQPRQAGEGAPVDMDGAGRKRNRRGRKRGRGDVGDGHFEVAGPRPDGPRREPGAQGGPGPERRADAADRFEQPPPNVSPLMTSLDRTLRKGVPRPERSAKSMARFELEGGFIPNPLLQTYDKRAAQLDKQRRNIPEDGPIPNPLLQTYDKRAAQQDTQRRDIPDDGPIPNPLQQTYDKRFVQNRKKPLTADPDKIPDPMQTAVGYIGAHAFHRKGKGGGKGGPRGGGGGGGSGGGGPRPRKAGGTGGAPGGGSRGKRGGGKRGGSSSR